MSSADDNSLNASDEGDWETVTSDSESRDYDTEDDYSSINLDWETDTDSHVDSEDEGRRPPPVNGDDRDLDDGPMEGDCEVPGSLNLLH